MTDYVLGMEPEELERLRFQQEVWGAVTDRFLDRLGLRAGWHCLDLGSGPGLVVPSLRNRVGTSGAIVALDGSPQALGHLDATIREHGWSNVRCLQAQIEDAVLEPDSFDFIFARWVLSFVPAPGDVLRKLARALRPGGIVAIQDYNHEGLSLFPESDGFRTAVRATRALLSMGGGDLWIGARLPALFREAGLTTMHFEANVLCGTPDSPAYRWADMFFPYHSAGMVRAGALTAAERERFLEQWRERRANPDAVFFSPIVVDAAARKGGT